MYRSEAWKRRRGVGGSSQEYMLWNGVIRGGMWRDKMRILKVYMNNVVLEPTN